MIKVNMPFYDGIEDFTFFVKKADIPIKFIELPKRNVNLLQWDDTVQLEFDFGSGVATLVGRLNVSSCYGGEAVSCSFRATQEIPKLATLRYHEAAYAINHCGYKPSTRQSTPDQAEQTELYLNSEKDLCDIIYNRIFSAAPAGAQGLIIVAGATATGKSRIARGLIYKYLATQIPTGSVNDRKRRRPHLVTVEEPIDKLWAADYDGARQTGIDYTPRERKKDVKDLKDAVDASLRQTPKVPRVLYVSTDLKYGVANGMWEKFGLDRRICLGGGHMYQRDRGSVTPRTRYLNSFANRCLTRYRFVWRCG